MIKACEYKTCCNFFTLGRKKKFCSTRCNLNDGRQAWKVRNVGKYKHIEREKDLRTGRDVPVVVVGEWITGEEAGL